MASPHPDKKHSYTVTYVSENHWAVLTQCWGSVWPKVLPYCLFNTAVAMALDYLKFVRHIDLEITTTTYTSMSLVVAFLIVSRATVTIARYNEARNYLSDMFRTSRELIQTMIVFSALHNADAKGQAWRLHVAKRTLWMLRTAMNVMDYSTSGVPAWKLPELIRTGEAARLQQLIYLHHKSDEEEKTSTSSSHRQFALHSRRTEREENMRVPILMALELRRAIHSQTRALSTPLAMGEENKLLASVDGFMNGYYGMRKHLTTPFPFPLVQMARTFLFLYVFTVPFALLSDTSYFVAHYIIIFFLTYGFFGLEMVSIELDDPWGNDANDFNNLRMMYTAFEDTYTTIRDVDGDAATDELRRAMHVPSDEPLPPEQQWLAVV